MVGVLIKPSVSGRLSPTKLCFLLTWDFGEASKRESGQFHRSLGPIDPEWNTIRCPHNPTVLPESCTIPDSSTIILFLSSLTAILFFVPLSYS